jgi:choline dehydrogenase
MILPDSTHTLVLGGGTGGCVLSGLLAEATDTPIVLLEAGPDYGDRSNWPGELLNAGDLPITHDWHLSDDSSIPGRTVPLPRGRVLGGSSSVNGCAAIWGTAADYDGWVTRGLPGWSAHELQPLFAQVHQRLHAKPYPLSALTPFQHGFLEAAVANGIPQVSDLNDLWGGAGIAPAPFNTIDGTRWNMAFAYLNPIRHKPNLTIYGNITVDRVLLEHGRCVGAVVITEEGTHTIRAERVVLAGGSYGSPAILLRSGIGDPALLNTWGIAVEHALPGVGRNLHDHPAFELAYPGTALLEQQTAAFAASQFAPAEQVIAKVCSTASAAPFDLHIYPMGGYSAADGGQLVWRLPVGVVSVASRGSLTLRSRDPKEAPIINHGYLSDPAGQDVATLVAGLQITRAIASSEPLRSLLGDELEPSASAQDAAALAAFVRGNCFHYYHPVGTCAMGPESDPQAVTNQHGQLHGISNLYIADASVMPIVPRANTNIPTAVVASKIAMGLISD